MSEHARRERDAALAALESHPEVAAEESVVAPGPTAAHPTVPAAIQPRGPSAGTIAAGSGAIALFAGLNQWLQQNGVTLADLTMNSGPLSGSLVANWPVVLLGAWALWVATRRWHEHVAWTHLRAITQDLNSCRQVKAIRAVADEITGLRTEMATQAAIARDHAGRLDAVERDVRELRGRVPERRRSAQPD